MALCPRQNLSVLSLILFHHVSFFRIKNEINSCSTISELSHYQNSIATVLFNNGSTVIMVIDPMNRILQHPFYSLTVWILEWIMPFSIISTNSGWFFFNASLNRASHQGSTDRKVGPRGPRDPVQRNFEKKNGPRRTTDQENFHEADRGWSRTSDIKNLTLDHNCTTNCLELSGVSEYKVQPSYIIKQVACLMN